MSILNINCTCPPHGNGLMTYVSAGQAKGSDLPVQSSNNLQIQAQELEEEEEGNEEVFDSEEGDSSSNSSTSSKDDEQLSAEEVKDLESLRDLDKIYNFLPSSNASSLSQSTYHHHHHHHHDKPENRSYRSASILAFPDGGTDAIYPSTTTTKTQKPKNKCFANRRNTIVVHTHPKNDGQHDLESCKPNPVDRPQQHLALVDGRKNSRGHTPEREELLALKRRLSVAPVLITSPMTGHATKKLERKMTLIPEIRIDSNGSKDLSENDKSVESCQTCILPAITENGIKTADETIPTRRPSLRTGQRKQSINSITIVPIKNSNDTLYVAKPDSCNRKKAANSPILFLPTTTTSKASKDRYNNESPIYSNHPSSHIHQHSSPSTMTLTSPKTNEGSHPQTSTTTLSIINPSKKFTFQRTPSLEKLLSIS